MKTILILTLILGCKFLLSENLLASSGDEYLQQEYNRICSNDSSCSQKHIEKFSTCTTLTCKQSLIYKLQRDEKFSRGIILLCGEDQQCLKRMRAQYTACKATGEIDDHLGLACEHRIIIKLPSKGELIRPSSHRFLKKMRGKGIKRNVYFNLTSQGIAAKVKATGKVVIDIEPHVDLKKNKVLFDVVLAEPSQSIYGRKTTWAVNQSYQAAENVIHNNPGLLVDIEPYYVGNKIYFAYVISSNPKQGERSKLWWYYGKSWDYLYKHVVKSKARLLDIEMFKKPGDNGYSYAYSMLKNGGSYIMLHSGISQAVIKKTKVTKLGAFIENNKEKYFYYSDNKNTKDVFFNVTAKNIFNNFTNKGYEVIDIEKQKTGKYIVTIDDSVRPEAGNTNTVKPLFSYPFVEKIYIANFFDHDLPFQGSDEYKNDYVINFRGDKTTNQIDGHSGYDWNIDENTVLLSLADGVVVRVVKEGAAPDSKYCTAKRDDGKPLTPLQYVTIRYSDPDNSARAYEVLYLHIKQSSLKVGDIVKEGQQIAISGNSGCSTAPHLHLEIYLVQAGKSDVRIDPYGWEGSSKDPWENWSKRSDEKSRRKGVWLWKKGKAPYID